MLFCIQAIKTEKVIIIELLLNSTISIAEGEGGTVSTTTDGTAMCRISGPFHLPFGALMALCRQLSLGKCLHFAVTAPMALTVSERAQRIVAPTQHSAYTAHVAAAPQLWHLQYLLLQLCYCIKVAQNCSGHKVATK